MNQLIPLSHFVQSADGQCLPACARMVFSCFTHSFAKSTTCHCFCSNEILDYYQEDFAHALVIVGSTADHQFWIHDPVYQNSPLHVSWDGLLAAWAEFWSSRCNYHIVHLLKLWILASSSTCQLAHKSSRKPIEG